MNTLKVVFGFGKLESDNPEYEFEIKTANPNNSTILFHIMEHCRENRNIDLLDQANRINVYNDKRKCVLNISDDKFYG